MHRPPMILPDAFLCESPRAICKTVSRTNKRAIHICFWPQIPLSCDLIRPVGLMTPHGAFNRISRSHKTPAFLLMLLLWVVDYQSLFWEKHPIVQFVQLILWTLLFCWDWLDFWGPRDSNDLFSLQNMYVLWENSVCRYIRYYLS